MKMKLAFIAGWLLLAGLPLLAAQEISLHAKNTGTPETTSTANPATPQLQARDNRYHLAAGDTFEVEFELSPEFNQTVTIQPDGYIALKAIGDLKVVDQTVPELTQTLRSAYAKILNDPLIAVMLKDFEKPYFIADGQVSHPGKYEMRGNITLAEAVAIAGGFTENAKHSQVLLFRRVNEQWVSAKIFNIKEMEKKHDLHEDPTLHPGDMVLVPKNTLSKIKPFIPSTGMGAYSQIYTPH
jgi:polysaccharide export outer membrane protein